MQLPFRRYNEGVNDIYEEIVKLRREGRKAALATIINVRGSIPSFQSAKMLVRDDGSILGTVGGGCVEAEVWQAAREVIEKERPTTLTFNLNHDPKYDTGLVCGGTLEIYIEPVLPAALLYLFGAGHVAVNTYKIALLAGFDVIVVDDRESYANRERFPEAREARCASGLRFAMNWSVKESPGRSWSAYILPLAWILGPSPRKKLPWPLWRR